MLLLLIAIFTNCSKDKNKLVDSELAIYVDRFFAEATLRGMELTDDNLEVVFRDLSEEGVCGLGYSKFMGTDLRKVEISQNFFCWGFQEDLAKENLVFHELGHAILRLSHANNMLPNGLPTEMMCDGNACDVFAYYDKYTLGKRAYYLDKLFRLSTPAPNWSKVKSRETIFFEEDAESDQVAENLALLSTNFKGTIAENPISQSKSIALEAVEKLTGGDEVGEWIIRLESPVISEGVDLKFTTQIASENLSGAGINLILRTYSRNNSETEISAATSKRINNLTNLTNQIEALTLTYFPSDVQQIEIILQILPNTSGTVYFDNLKLSVMEF